MSEKTAYVFREISINNKHKQIKKAIDVSDFVSVALEIIESQAEAGLFEATVIFSNFYMKDPAYKEFIKAMKNLGFKINNWFDAFVYGACFIFKISW